MNIILLACVLCTSNVVGHKIWFTIINVITRVNTWYNTQNLWINIRKIIYKLQTIHVFVFWISGQRSVAVVTCTNNGGLDIKFRISSLWIRLYLQYQWLLISIRGAQYTIHTQHTHQSPLDNFSALKRSLITWDINFAYLSPFGDMDILQACCPVELK